jgi:hypothetical protein
VSARGSNPVLANAALVLGENGRVLKERCVERIAPTLAPDATPADQHFIQASQLVHIAGSLSGEHQRITIESVKAEVALGMRAIAERRLTANPIPARDLESMVTR